MIDLLESRRSVRSYKEEPLPVELKDALRSEITYINSHEAGLNFQLTFDDPKPFEGFRKSYGMFRNVRNYMTAVIDPTFPNTYERAGFFAQQFVMEALKRGLGSCFVGVTFSRSEVDARVEVYEKIPFIVAFGFPEVSRATFIGKLTSRMAHRNRKAPEDFFVGTEDIKEELRGEGVDVGLALRAVACAPSSLNKQPVRLTGRGIEGRMHLCALVENYDKNAVDLGIAKYNVSAAIPGFWDWGNDAPFHKD